MVMPLLLWPGLTVIYLNHHFFRELKAQHEREMDFLHNTHSDQVHNSATKFIAHTILIVC